MLSTDDLLLIAALARSGKPAAASTSLNVHLATVYRRLKELEQEAGAPLFQRLGGQYIPTPLGSELVRAATAVAASLAEARRQLAGGEQRLEGRITLTTPDSLVPLVTALLPLVRRKHAGIRFDLVVSNAFADMARYEAEVAIRPTRSPPETLVGQRAGAFRYAIYAKTGSATDLPWIALDDSLSAIPAARWLAVHVAEEGAVLRVNSMWAAAQAAAAGLGQALLPDYLHRSFDLERRSGFIDTLESEVWLLVHPDLRRTPRIQAFMDLAAGKLRAQLKAG